MLYELENGDTSKPSSKEDWDSAITFTARTSGKQSSIFSFFFSFCLDSHLTSFWAGSLERQLSGRIFALFSASFEELVASLPLAVFKFRFVAILRRMKGTNSSFDSLGNFLSYDFFRLVERERGEPPWSDHHHFDGHHQYRRSGYEVGTRW